MTKVSIQNRDEILGAIVRALAVQVAGFQVVGGMNKEYLKQNGFYDFKFSGVQVDRFRTLVNEYVPDKLSVLIKIEAN